jgi:hypothetical protein
MVTVVEAEVRVDAVHLEGLVRLYCCLAGIDFSSIASYYSCCCCCFTNTMDFYFMKPIYIYFSLCRRY